MRAIRSQDGIIYHLSREDLPRPPTIEAFHSILSEHAEIPISALIVMHPNGRQVDRDSLAALLLLPNDADIEDDSDHNERDKDKDKEGNGTVYLFDREVLQVDLDSEDGIELLHALHMDIDRVLADVGNNPDRQYELCMDLIQCIRHQHLALTAALYNLERHRGGRQEAITAYNHFASPLLTKYRDLLAVYPACMSLVSKVRVSAKMQASPSSTASAKERLLSDFVSREKMENVRDGCQRTLDEIMTKHSDLEKLLRSVAEGTDKLKIDKEEASQLDDLVDCENDAHEARSRLSYLMSRQEAPTEEDEDEMDALLDESVGRVRYLVDRRNAETKQLLHSLQEIARLQSQIASAPELISSLNQDLKTKTDSFKHLTRLQLLVPAYAATLAESIRRRAFTKHLTSSSSAYAELFGKLTSDERRRRGIYQVEWAGKLPWELPGLEEGLASIEVELRSSNANLAQRTSDAEVTVEDLIALEQALLDLQENLSPEDMPSGGLPHPVKETTVLIEKLKRGIESLQQDFEKINNKLDDSAASPSTSVSVTGSANEAMQALEERRIQLERSLQAERSTREAEVAALTVRNSELEKRLADGAAERASLLQLHERARRDTETSKENALREAQDKVDEQVRRARQFEDESREKAIELSRLQEELQRAKEHASNVQYDLEAQERRNDQLEKRKQDLLQALGEKDRLLRDHRTESELDRATLEKELAEVKDKLHVAEEDIITHAKSLDSAQETAKQKISQQENEIAELQTMCDERGRSISEMRNEAQAVSSRIRTMLGLCEAYHSQCTSFLRHFVREDVTKFVVGTSSQSASRVRGPAATFNPADQPPFDDSSLENAIAFMQDDRSHHIWSVAKAQCDFCLHEVKKWQKECKRYRDRMDKAMATSKDKLAFRSFHQNDLALFLPTKNKSVNQHIFAAFNFGRPNYFLKPTGRLVDDVENKDWIVARISSITEGVVDTTDVADGNPYQLRAGSKYFMLEAEYWPNTPQRVAQRSVSASKSNDAVPRGSTGGNDGQSSTSRIGIDQGVQANEDEIAETQGQASSNSGISNSGMDSPARLIAPQGEQMVAQEVTKESSTPEMVLETSYMTVTSPIEESSATIADDSALLELSETPTRPSAMPSSSLSSSRPPDLVAVEEDPTLTAESDQATTCEEDLTTKQIPAGKAQPEESKGAQDVDDTPPAFISPKPQTSALGLAASSATPRAIPRSSSNAARQSSTTFSRSFGSSNGSGGSAGYQGRLSSSSYLTPSKAPATIAASPSTSFHLKAENGSGSGFTSASPAKDGPKSLGRISQTIGRYNGKSSHLQGPTAHRRQSSLSGASASSPPSAEDLLRSFTKSRGTS